MTDYSKLDLYTLKFLYDEYKNKERTKREELRTITAEIELIEAFIDHTSKLIYRAQQHQDNQQKEKE
jgi:hypothetical protein